MTVSQKEINKYFNLVQPYQHHTNCPAQVLTYIPSQLHPKIINPLGTCNFSRIDNAFLTVTHTDNTVSSSAIS